MADIDGPRLEPASGNADALVVLLHGYGANGEDLYDIAESWAPFLPDIAFVSPHAPEACPMAPGGRQWFPLTMRDEAERWTGVVAAGPALDRFLDAELERWGVSPDRLVLVGFSQGTMMALHVGLRRSVAPAAIVGYSGILIMPNDAMSEDFAAQIKSRPTVLLIHGDADQMIPVQAVTHSAQALAELDVPVEWHISPGVGHGIDQEGLRHGGEFLAKQFVERR